MVFKNLWAADNAIGEWAKNRCAGGCQKGASGAWWVENKLTVDLLRSLIITDLKFETGIR
jgi:hypothetical protein